MVRLHPAGIRLITRNGHNWSGRFPLIAQAALALNARLFLLDGEAVACDRDGQPSSDRLRYRRGDGISVRLRPAETQRRRPAARAFGGAQGLARVILAKAGSGLCSMSKRAEHRDTQATSCQ